MNARTGWLAATCYPVGSLGDYSWSYSWDGYLSQTRQQAIRVGFRCFGSDDFNIGHVTNGVLDWWGWMDEEHPDDLASAAAGLYLNARADAIEAGTKART